MDMSYLAFTRGLPKVIAPGEPADYITSIIFIVPLDKNKLKSGTYSVQDSDKNIVVVLGEVAEAKNDLIWKLGHNLQIGASGTAVSTLPFNVFTDNRGKYPAITVELVFPYRVASWIDPSHPSGISMDNDLERLQIVGSPPDQDKVDSLIILNRLLKSPEYPYDVPTITYDDVTTYLQIYKISRTNRAILWRLVTLDGHNAYKDAILDYFLGENRPENTVADDFAESKQKIQNETDLVNVTLDVLNNVVRHHIENRYWIEPFWDDPGWAKVHGKKHKIRPKPKKEIKITPTFHVLLQEFLSPFKIHVERESDSGVGSLDFRCICTTETGVPICIVIEVKLAHSAGLKKGITKQLPAYLVANKSKTGIYLVVWFKGRTFSEPRTRKKEEMESWLNETADAVSSEHKVNITPLMIDASDRPTASKL